MVYIGHSPDLSGLAWMGKLLCSRGFVERSLFAFLVWWSLPIFLVEGLLQVSRVQLAHALGRDDIPHTARGDVAFPFNRSVCGPCLGCDGMGGGALRGDGGLVTVDIGRWSNRPVRHGSPPSYLRSLETEGLPKLPRFQGSSIHGHEPKEKRIRFEYGRLDIPSPAPWSSDGVVPFAYYS